MLLLPEKPDENKGYSEEDSIRPEKSRKAG